MRRSWLRRNRLIETLRHTSSVLEGFWFLPQADQRFFKSAHFFGEAPERRPWDINAKIARLLFPGAPNPAFLLPLAVGIPPVPIQASILSHPHHLPTASTRHTERNLRNQREIIVRTTRATTAAHYSMRHCGAHSLAAWPERPPCARRSGAGHALGRVVRIVDAIAS